MKVNKLVTLDIEIVEKLKSHNASKLVNQLLHEHFQTSRSDPDAEIREIEKNLKKKMKILRKKKQIRAKLKQIGLDSKHLAWLKGNYPDVSPVAWSSYCRGRQTNIPYMEISTLLKKHPEILENDF